MLFQTVICDIVQLFTIFILMKVSKRNSKIVVYVQKTNVSKEIEEKKVNIENEKTEIEKEKIIKKINKKLRQIDHLEELKAKGIVLTKAEEDKISKKMIFQSELKSLSL